MKQTAEPLNKLLKIFNESPYGRLSHDSHEAKGIKDVLDSVLASYKAELMEKIGIERPLSEKPQKDGVITEYSCGFFVRGGWDTRLTNHKIFIESPIGEYILKIEALLEDNPTEK